MILAGFNHDGAKSKISSIKKLVRESKAVIVTMQEQTKCSEYGQLKLDGSYIYEHLRSNREGGGVALRASKELNPAFVSDGGEEAEAVTVTIHLKGMAMNVISAYGPLENVLKASWNNKS